MDVERQCNDGGGRQGRPTVLSQLVRRRPQGGIVPLTEEDLSALAAECLGSGRVQSLLVELRGMEARGTIALYYHRVWCRGDYRLMVRGAAVTPRGFGMVV